VSGHHQVTENGLFQHGYSKDHRPDLAQYKVMLATLDPMGLPLVSLIVSGEQSDDGLYIPTIKRSQRIVGKGGHLYVGDSKLSSHHNRAYIAKSKDYYLTVLPRRHQGEDEISRWLAPVLKGEQDTSLIKISTDDHQGEMLWAVGYEATRQQHTEIDDQPYDWQERVAVVFHPAQAKQSRLKLENRLKKAEQALRKLTSKWFQLKPRWKKLADLEAATQHIIKKYRVDGLLDIACHRQEKNRSVRAYGDRSARTEKRIRYEIDVKRNAQAIRETRQQLGWRLYVTNAPPEQLSFKQLIMTYRDAPRIELDFRRLKGRPLGLRPVYIHRDDHTIGLSRLLTLALRILTLTESVVREQLQLQQEHLQGLYPGQLKRATDRPTTERLLQVFKGINLSRVSMGGQMLRHVTALSPLQHQILELVGVSGVLYGNLASSEPQFPP
jgi:transposase